MLRPRGQSQITYFHRPTYIVAANLPDGSYHRLFQVRLKGGTDPSLAIDFAYVPFPSGLARLALSKTPLSRTESFEWLDPAMAVSTNHHPKYSHHCSGRAHFSQTGKVESFGRYACPLRQINGHAFSVALNDPAAFPELRTKDIKGHNAKERGIVIFSSFSQSKSWVTIAGRVFERDTYFDSLDRSGLWCEKHDDFTRCHFPDGRVKTVAILTEPTEQLSSPSSLLLELSLIPRDIGGDGTPIFLFIGGFDHRNWKLGQDQPGFLAMRYPAMPEPRDLNLIRSMDIIPKQPWE